MAEYSTFLRIPYPEENQDPFWDTWKSFVQELDKHVYMAKVKSNLMLLGGGTVTFDSGTGVLEWTEDFTIPYLETGYKLVVSYGPTDGFRQATLSDGEILYVEIPYAMAQDVTVQCYVASTLDGASDKWVLGVRSGDHFYFKGKEEI